MFSVGSARQYEKGFPGSLNKAPILLPTIDNPIRRALDDWFDQQGISPTLVAEFEDSALMKAFGQAGVGVFIAPSPIAEEVEKQYGVKVLGQTNDVHEQFYAISAERKISHPAVAAITETAGEWLYKKPAGVVA